MPKVFSAEKAMQAQNPFVTVRPYQRRLTREIAAVRGRPEGTDIISPARFEDIRTREDLRRKVAWLREQSGGKPVGVKVAAAPHLRFDDHAHLVQVGIENLQHSQIQLVG